MTEQRKFSHAAAAVLVGIVTLGVSFGLYFLVRTLQPHNRAYSFAAMCVGLIVGPCAAAPIIERAFRRSLGAASVALGGVLGGVFIYSHAVLFTTFLQSFGAHRGVPCLNARVAWWALAFLGPLMGVAARPLTSSRILLLILSTMAGVFLIGSQVAPAAQDAGLTTLCFLPHVLHLVARRSEVETGRAQTAESSVGIVIALAVVAGPAALLLWLGFLSELPLYWRRC